MFHGQQHRWRCDPFINYYHVDQGGVQDGTVCDFDSCPVPQDKMGQSRKGGSKTGKDVLKHEKDFLK